MPIDIKSVFLVTNCISIILNLASILSPWLSFSATSPIATHSGSIYLYETLGCNSLSGNVQSNIAKGSCMLITIGDLPDRLSYIRQAIHIGMAFTIISLLFNTYSGCIEYLNKRNKLSLIPVKLSFLGHINTSIITHSIIVASNMIAFSSFSGLINSNFNIEADGSIIGFTGTIDKKWNYGGGFGLSIVVFIFSTGALISKFIQKNMMKSDENKTILNPMIPSLPPPEHRPEYTV